MKKRKLFLLIISFLFLFTVFSLKNQILKQFVAIELSVDFSKNFQNGVYSPNNMLFLIIENSKGQPVGFKKIIGPIYPIKVKIGPENILFEDLLSFRTNIRAVMNKHGFLGEEKSGDYFSSQKIKANIISKELHIDIDSIVK